MALIQCPNCGKEISNKAQSCVYCGCIFSQKTKKTCPECGNEIDQDVTVCPRCGYPIAFEEEEGVVPTQKNKEKQPKNKKKKRILLSAFMVVLIAVLCFGFAQIKEKEYAVNLYNATYTMLQGCADAEAACNLIKKHGVMQYGRSLTKRQTSIQSQKACLFPTLMMLLVIYLQMKISRSNLVKLLKIKTR